MARPKFIQAKKSFLKTPMSDSETGSFVLNQLVDCYGNEIVAGNYAGTIRFTFNPGGSDEEIVSATGFTQNDDGSVTVDTGIVRALKAVYPYTTGGTSYNHAAGTPVVIMADNPQLFEDICAYIDTLVLAAAVGATKTAYGYVKTAETLGVIPRVMTTLVSQKSSQPSMVLTVQPFAVSALDKDVALVTATDTSAMVAPVTNPRVDLVVYDTVNSIVAVRTGTENASLTTSNYMTYKPTPTVGDIVLAAVFHRVSEVKVLEEDDSTNGFIIRWYTPEVYGTTTITPTGSILPYGGRSAPTGFALCDGSAVSRSGSYALLFAVICPSQTFTVTIASPGVFTTSSNHGLVIGDPLHFTTSGGLPSGLSAAVTYYVISAGLTATSFEVALSPGGVAVNTTGSQSGTHTLYKSAWGMGDGSTTFNLPDLRSKVPIGLAAAASTFSLSFEPAAVNTGTDLVTILNTVFPSQGQPIVLTTTGTLPAGLSLATTYYIIRASTTTIKFSSSQANADAGTAIDITDTGSGVHTLTYTTRTHTVLGRYGGEDTHGLNISELAAHTHTYTRPDYSNVSQGGGGTVSAASSSQSTGSAGGDTQHNNLQPFATVNYIVKL